MIVKIFAVTGRGAGTGHFRRMKDLEKTLRKEGEEVFFKEVLLPPRSRFELDRLLENSDGPRQDPGGKPAIHLLDLRDVPLSGGRFSSPVIALDNASMDRIIGPAPENLFYYDTLPHPGAPPDAFLNNFLFSAETFDCRETNDWILIYSGPFPADWIDERMARDSPGSIRVIRVGNSLPASQIEGFSWFPSLAPEEFRNLLCGCRIRITYPGQTLLEAWTLKKRPLLLPTPSPVHESLGRALMDRFPDLGILYSQEFGREGRESLASLDFPGSLPVISENGRDRLIAFLRERIAF